MSIEVRVLQHARSATFELVTRGPTYVTPFLIAPYLIVLAIICNCMTVCKP